MYHLYTLSPFTRMKIRRQHRNKSKTLKLECLIFFNTPAKTRQQKLFGMLGIFLRRKAKTRISVGWAERSGRKSSSVTLIVFHFWIIFFLASGFWSGLKSHSALILAHLLKRLSENWLSFWHKRLKLV